MSHCEESCFQTNLGGNIWQLTICIFFFNQGPIEVKFTKYEIHHFNVCAYIQGVQPSSPLFSFKNISSTSGDI